MSRIETYVFLHSWTTGPILQFDEGDFSMPEVIEISMLAVKRTALFLCERNTEPRVQNKFQMCFKTSCITAEGLQASGLDDILLEKEASFDHKAFNAINSFIDCLEKPVCLIAHSGFLFQFPILKYHLEKMNLQLASDVKCADSIQLFFDLVLEERFGHLYTSVAAGIEERETDEKIGKGKPYLKVLRKPYYEPDIRPAESYDLVRIYERRVKGRNLGRKQKTAEGYCFMMMKIAQTLKGFESFVQKDHCLFSEIPIYPTTEETWYLDEDHDVVGPEETTEVKDSSSGLKEAKESSSEQKEDKSSSRWYDIFNYF